MRLRLLATAALALMGGEGARAQSATDLDEIVVETASPIVGEAQGPDPQRDRQGVLPVAPHVFAPVTILPRDEIARRGPTTLGGALADKPGVASTGFAPGAADRPIIRGLEGQRVRILENGLGVHDVSALGEDHGVPFNPLSADRIEVIRGPATLRYGSSAIGGVVNAENDRIPRFAPPGGFSAEALAGLSSVDRGRSIAAAVKAGHGDILFHADGFATKNGNYDTPDGQQAKLRRPLHRGLGRHVGGDRRGLSRRLLQPLRRLLPRAGRGGGGARYEARSAPGQGPARGRAALRRRAFRGRALLGQRLELSPSRDGPRARGARPRRPRPSRRS
ncbi:TonB-dependent receptor plug domain-containing protein [Chenggangzhangella methanolivorans]|uniref:TonB-dependent receptor plug domain-containing protein n=1 Tax=Chenggangzhangella methanolivorans TaxID=1437009 RepID=UPI0021BD735A|nr:TonB-dependent receptor plug domain-containing protein [Chenggangzhangella methanolivorans]